MQLPAYALIGTLLVLLIKHLLKRQDDRERRLDQVTDSFNKTMSNHIDHNTQALNKLSSAIDRIATKK